MRDFHALQSSARAVARKLTGAMNTFLDQCAKEGTCVDRWSTVTALQRAGIDLDEMDKLPDKYRLDVMRAYADVQGAQVWCPTAPRAGCY